MPACPARLSHSSPHVMNVSKEAMRGASLPFVLVSPLVCDDNGLRLFSQWTSEDEEVAVQKRARRLRGAAAGTHAAFARLRTRALRHLSNGYKSSCRETPRAL